MELYDWNQVDITDEHQKERVNQMILDHESFEDEQLILVFFSSSFDTNCFCVCREEKLLLHIEVAAQIIYLIILIVTSNTQITIEPTCLALNSTMAC